MMIYHAENHCRGATHDDAFYASIGYARSLDAHGFTWPTPDPSEATRYEVVDGPVPRPSVSPDALGDSAVSAFIDKGSMGSDYLYAYFIEYTFSTSYISVARAHLTGTDPPTFYKYSGGSSWTTPGLLSGAVTTNYATPLFNTSTQLGNCSGTASMKDPSIVETTDSKYVFVVTCKEGASGTYPGQRGFFYAVADNLTSQDWTPLYEAGGFSTPAPCGADGSKPEQKYDGWYPSVFSPGEEPGIIGGTGIIFELDGCLTGTRHIGIRPFSLGVPDPESTKRRAHPNASTAPQPAAGTTRAKL